MRSLRDAAPVPYWLDRPDRPDPLPPLSGARTADLAIVGGGYAGLWAAVLAKQDDPSLSVAVLEAGTCGWAASGRNGGFCATSLTGGLANGHARFPDDLVTLERLGTENLDAIESFVARHGIDCDFVRSGELKVATEAYQVAQLAESAVLAMAYGRNVRLLDSAAIRAEIDSPTYLYAAWDRRGTALVDPARLAWGLRRVCLELGVQIYEHTRVTALADEGTAVRLTTAHGRLRAGKAILATNAFPPLLRRLRHFVAPVYDYALMTEPLTGAQLASVGWRRRQGVSDLGNRFHYYRMTADRRILFGGYDPVFHAGGRMAPALAQRPASFETLARHFAGTFPQLADVRFSHKWGGAVDTSTRLFAFHGTAYGGKLAYAAGFTGLGVSATRFAARVSLDLLTGHRTDLTSLATVRRKPKPWPPEPARTLGIALTRRSRARADDHEGRPDLWLRTMRRLGIGP
ncbi:glycine/D-amino acid oxidase-like deaminating enzyme [Catenuloplanes nepalensis]|uniref:Glycine/D-amino acid oxidase-like deaminating enzyme n=1 Tax=Catenuloplanes nepalensis TaxID=587533 RepID=A0ABT9N7K3_9ACTN|nr:FAD-dependent oxidoreductase [Catenuloplanes nepalensis]MDP9799500.1 glycine/D-amino acid oxidase-like deaminating enzyme [Catenuloplanes nepalensis]